MRMPSPRRLTLLVLLAAAAGTTSVIMLGGVGFLAPVDTVQVATLVVNIALLAVVVINVRRVDGKVQRLIWDQRDDRRRLHKLADGLSKTSQQLGELTQTTNRLARVGVANYHQIENYVDLRALLQPRAPMPALRGWAVSPDLLHLLVTTVWRRRPKIIVECGSGSSSVWLGYAVERIGTGRVVALEHDERHAAISRDLVCAHGLADVVEIRLAPLQEWGDDQASPWYATSAIDDLADVGLVLVDGPPGPVAEQVRYPAVPLLLPRCTPDAVFVLDDTGRPDERAVSDRWVAEYPELERVVKKFDKGAHVFTRRNP